MLLDVVSTISNCLLSLSLRPVSFWCLPVHHLVVSWKVLYFLSPASV